MTCPYYCRFISVFILWTQRDSLPMRDLKDNVTIMCHCTEEMPGCLKPVHLGAVTSSYCPEDTRLRHANVPADCLPVCRG